MKVVESLRSLPLLAAGGINGGWDFYGWDFYVAFITEE